MDWPKDIPVMPLPRATLFPNTMLPLFIYESRYREMVTRSLKGHRLLAVAMQRYASGRETPCKIAGLGMIRAAVRHKDGTYHLILHGLHRVMLHKAVSYRPFRRYRYEIIRTERDSEERIAQLKTKLLMAVRVYLQQDLPSFASAYQSAAMDASPEELPACPSPESVETALAEIARVSDAELLRDLVSSTLLTEPLARQIVLEDHDLESRLMSLLALLSMEHQSRQDKDYWDGSET